MRIALVVHYLILLAAGLPGAMITMISAVYLVTVVELDPLIVGAFVNVSAIVGILINVHAGRGGFDSHNPATVAALSLGSIILSILCLLAVPLSVWMLVPATLFRAFSHLLVPAIYMFDERYRPPGTDPDTGMYMTRLTSSIVWILGPPCAFYLFWLGSFPAVAAVSIGLIGATAAAMIGVSIYTRGREEPDPPHQSDARTIPATGMPVWAVFMVMLMVTGANVLHSMTTPLYLIEELTVPSYWPGWNMTVAATTEVVIIFFIPKLVRRVSEEAILKTGLTLGAFYFGLLFFTQSPEIILALQVLYGAHFALSTVVCLGILKSASKLKMGSVAAQFTNASKIGGLFGTTLFALLAAHLGYGGLLRGVGLSLIVAGGLVFLARWALQKSMPKLAKFR